MTLRDKLLIVFDQFRKDGADACDLTILNRADLDILAEWSLTQWISAAARTVSLRKVYSAADMWRREGSKLLDRADARAKELGIADGVRARAKKLGVKEPAYAARVA